MVTSTRARHVGKSNLRPEYNHLSLLFLFPIRLSSSSTSSINEEEVKSNAWQEQGYDSEDGDTDDDDNDDYEHDDGDDE
jgi:hypothetical protein